MRRTWDRHPSAPALAAWFDGEADGGVGSHVVVCRRCRRQAGVLAEVRTALRPPATLPGAPAGRGTGTAARRH